MSNCATVYSTTEIPLSEIDHEQLFKDIEEFNKVDSEFDSDSLKKFVIYWFLGTDNVWIEKDMLCINFGDHRSIHTFRDLRQTIVVLGLYIPNKKTCFPLDLEDTTDWGAENRCIEDFRIDMFEIPEEA